jgi:hypothetical protein
MNDDEVLANKATEALIGPDPLQGEVRILALSEDEREYLLRVVGDAETGPAATARLKLRAAAPVREWGAKENARPSVFARIAALLQSDGRERGTCRWCKQRARVDQYQLCEVCTPQPAAAAYRT